MVTAGQWQAVKDTLSRPIGRNLTTSDTLVIQQQVQQFGHTPLIQQAYITIPINYATIFLLIRNLIR